MTPQRTSEEDAFLEGFHDIPSAEKLRSMSFVQLAILLSEAKPNSAKFIIIENAMLRHEESAKTDNTILGAKIGGIYTIIGVVIGGILAFITSVYQPPNIVQCQCGGNTTKASRHEQTSNMPIPKSPASSTVMLAPKEVNVPPTSIKADGEQANGNK